MKLLTAIPAALAATLCLAPAVAAVPEDLEVERVSLHTSGAEGNFGSNSPALSADGMIVAFHSGATTLVNGDTNFSRDVFVHDRNTGITTRVSVSTGGAQGNHHSENPSISADGRFVVFTSEASNLVASDNNGYEDVFMHDRTTGETTRVSVGEGIPGAQLHARSYDGRISADGNYVVFASGSTSLIANDLNGQTDVFRRELATGATILVSVSSLGVQGDNASWGPAISADGGAVAFHSTATTLAAVADTNGHQDVFVHDLGAGTTARVSESTQGAQGNSYSHEPTISGDGRFIAFTSRATTLVSNDNNFADDVYLHDRQTGETTMVSVHTNGTYGNNLNQNPSISANGRFIAFHSWSSNLVARDNNFQIDIFVHDTLAEVTRRVDLDSIGGETDLHSYEPAISADGRYVAFLSEATNLIADDANGWGDIYVKDYLGQAAVTSRNGGLNPVSYSASLPTLGQVWDVSVDVSTTGHGSAMVVGKLSPTSASLPSGYELLITGPRAFQLAALPGPLASWSIPLPDDTSLVGIRVYTQAVHLFGITPVALSNAQDLCIGY